MVVFVVDDLVGIAVPLRDYKIPPTPKILENYSKITIWRTPGLS